MATENPDWGYQRIQGALANLGHEVARTTMANILKESGLEPAPERNCKTTWKEFLSRHGELIVAADFFTLEAWTRRGLARFVVLFFIDLSSRRVGIAGLAWQAKWTFDETDRTEPHGPRRRLPEGEAVPDPRGGSPVHGRASRDSGSQRGEIGEAADPNLNAHAERFARTIKETCLEQLILFGEGSLRKAIHDFVLHYHHKRNRQGLDNRLIMEEESYMSRKGAVQRRQRLGGMLNYYYRQAA